MYENGANISRLMLKPEFNPKYWSKSIITYQKEHFKLHSKNARAHSL